MKTAKAWGIGKRYPNGKFYDLTNEIANMALETSEYIGFDSEYSAKLVLLEYLIKNGKYNSSEWCDELSDIRDRYEATKKIMETGEYKFGDLEYVYCVEEIEIDELDSSLDDNDYSGCHIYFPAD